FDHLELRWERCQTVLPSPDGYTGVLPDEPPALVNIDQVAAAFLAIAAPKKPEEKPRYQQPAAVVALRSDTGHRYVEAAVRGKVADALDRVRTAPDGQKHHTLRDMALLCGGVLHHGVHTEQELADLLLETIAPRADDLRQAEATITWGLAHGQQQPIAIEPPAPRRNGHHTNEPGGTRTPSQRIIDTLTSVGYHFRLNLCTDDLECNNAPLTDIVAAHIRTHMRDTGHRGMEAVDDACIVAAARHSYHPVCDYLDSLHWDGQDHIAALAAHLHCPDEPVCYANGSARGLLHTYLLRWLVGAVGKAFDQRQNAMLVLAGEQNIGKSAFVSWLCGGLPGYFIEGPINVADKDNDVRLMSKFIWEVSELDATTRKADVSALKAFITKGIVTVRKAYGKRDTVKPALASMVGTVNDATGFLTDETGNRRFYAVHVSHIDWSYRHLDVDQVWAQAVALYRAGEPWRLLPEEVQRQTEQNRLFEAETPMEGWILKHFDLTGDPADVLTAADIFDHLRTKGVQRQGTRGDAMGLSAVLRRLGVVKDRLGKDRARVYLGIAPRETPASLTPPDGGRTTSTNRDQPAEQGCPPGFASSQSSIREEADNLTNLSEQKGEKLSDGGSGGIFPKHAKQVGQVVRPGGQRGDIPHQDKRDQPSEGCPPVGHQVVRLDEDAPAPPLDPVLTACAAVGVPDEVLDDTYFLPALRDAATEVARGRHTQARDQVRYHVRGSHKGYAVQVIDHLVARQAWEQQVGEDDPPRDALPMELARCQGIIDMVRAGTVDRAWRADYERITYPPLRQWLDREIARARAERTAGQQQGGKS
ncbi:MAG: hypothetical protein HC828_07410, partial [Blastochloris sp.]|nr:hypothetical protein [Blastochloris sp.]